MRPTARRLLGAMVATALTTTGLVAVQSTPALASYAVPPTPSGLTSQIEYLEPYIGQAICDPVAKPGVSAFRNLLLRTYPDSGSLGIVRDCGAGGQSEHKEGRAFDWKMSAYNSRQAGEVQALISWLLKTDQYGNTYAMARRLGIMYMIWNHRIWKAYDTAAGWQPYDGASAHTDHVHFSFGWNAAKKVTSYWDGTYAPVDFGPAGPPHITPVRSLSNLTTLRQYGQTTLAKGSGGTAVSVIQRALKVSPIDGDFGSVTGAHVARFQVDQKLPMTMRFGPREWKALFPLPQNPIGGVDAPVPVAGNAIVRGWALDLDTSGPVSVDAVVDGQVVQTSVADLPRNDVQTKYPEWGSEHGYQLLLPSLDPTKPVCVVAHNATGTPGLDANLGCATVDSALEAHSPIGALESLAPEQSQVRLTGWALDPDSPDTLITSVTVDGQPAQAVPQVQTRSDIAALFPNAGDQHGVTALLDVPEGTHTVCLEAANVSSTAGIDSPVGCRKITVAHSPAGTLTTVRRAPDGVLVTGTAVDPDTTGPVQVDVLSDSVVVATTQTSAKAFSTVAPLAAGTHQVCVRLHNVDATPGTDTTLPCRSIALSNDAAGVLSVLRNVPGGAIAFAGDAYDPDTLAAVPVSVLVDGIVARIVTAGRTSTARWPGYGATHGFAGTVTPTTGLHYLCVRAENAQGTLGAAKVLGCHSFWVHSAVGKLTSVYVSGRTLTLRGWGIDPDTTKVTSVVLRVDGRYMTSVTANGRRADLASAMPGYGLYHGFVLLRTLTAGTHTVCITVRNVLGTAGSSRRVGCRTLTLA